jgi:hypothetical protein
MLVRIRDCWTISGLESDKISVILVAKIVPTNLKLVSGSGSEVFARLKIRLRASFRDDDTSLQNRMIFL